VKTLTSSIVDFNRTASEVLPKAKFAVYTLEELVNSNQEFSLSKELVKWYTTAAPIDLYIPKPGNDLELYDPMYLRQNHNGYRWVPDPNTVEFTDLTKYNTEDILWDINWIMIGDIGGDPVIAHTDQPGTPISLAEHGIGIWSPRPISATLSDFLDILSFYLQFVFHEMNGIDDFFDADLNILPEVHMNLRNKLSQFNNEKYVDNIIWFLGAELL
jgi:hypothetical protein